jgi:hypothetical protein
MLNWARPAYTVANLCRYDSYSVVSQVLCFNNGPSLRGLASIPKKCTLIEASRDVGLYSRLAAASLAGTDAIFHTDDDLAVPETTMRALFEAWQKARLCCHGLYGRVVRPVYQRGNAFGQVEVVLTRALLCSRLVNNAALSAVHLFEDLVSVPRGNGEDIILSFAAMASSRSLNYAYRLPSEEFPRDGYAIHRRWPSHFKHRESVVSRCREVFSVP